MKVLTKSQAQAEAVRSLFKSGGTFTLNERVKFCTGKYNASIIGRELNTPYAKNCHAIWAERRQDKDGAYYTLYCVPVVERASCKA